MTGAASSVTVMDGGMGAELARRGVISDDAPWSATALMQAPDEVVATHRDFIAAGAELIITNSYSCTPESLAKVGLAHRYAELAGVSGRLARAAVDGAGGETLVAGGLPPLSQSYRSDVVPADEEARPIYANLAAALEPHVDLFICETMSSIRESRNAVAAAKQAAIGRGLPVYVSWTLDERPGCGLRSGESVKHAWAALADLDPDGYLFNCTHPDAIAAGVAEIVALTDKPTGGYANRFDVPADWTGENGAQLVHRAGSGTEQFVRAGLRWIELGATVVGGCCRIGPADIAALAARLRQS